MEIEDCATSAKSVPNGNGVHKDQRINSKLEDATKERIAILDFGAQFGKVFVSYFILIKSMLKFLIFFMVSGVK